MVQIGGGAPTFAVQAMGGVFPQWRLRAPWLESRPPTAAAGFYHNCVVTVHVAPNLEGQSSNNRQEGLVTKRGG